MNLTTFDVPYASTSDIPMKKYKNLHRQYWEFIADNELGYKPEIKSSITGEFLRVMFRCFACEYTMESFNGYIFRRCRQCPFKCFRRTDEVPLTGCENVVGSPYAKWKLSKDPRYAREIANLEWEDTHTHD